MIRLQQKHRTRTALVDAARELVGEGESPTVEDAAARAGISRTTAYRYFRDQAELLAAAHPETQRTSLLPDKAPSDVEARVEAAVREFVRIILETEEQQRTMLRLSLDPRRPSGSLPLRQGRGIAWFEDALSPLAKRWTKTKIHKLAIALRTTAGIEALVWLTDVAGLSRAEAARHMQWTAMMLLNGALRSDT